MCGIEDTLKREGKMPTYYKRYVDDTLTIMPDKTSAVNFLEILNQCHFSIIFTMETEGNGMRPFLGTQLLNKHTYAETQEYVKPTNAGLLLHYKSHVDDQYKRGLLRTMLDRAFRLSSNWSYFSEECDPLKLLFSRLKYPEKLVNSTFSRFIAAKALDQPVSSPTVSDRTDSIRVVLPLKDQASADIVRVQKICVRRSIRRYLSARRSNKISSYEKQRHRLWTNGALFINLGVTCAMQVMVGLHAAICTNVFKNTEAWLLLAASIFVTSILWPQGI